MKRVPSHTVGVMKPAASNSTATLTGSAASVAGCLLGPLADRRDVLGDVCLILLVAGVVLPAWFFVFGVRKDDRVEGWMLEPALVGRIAMFIAGAAATALVLSVVSRAF